MSDLSSGFYKLYEKGLTGEYLGLPIPFEKLDDVFHGLQQSRYWLVGGLTGSGKTAMVDEAFVLDIFDWWYQNYQCDESNFKISWIYNSMERNKNLKIAKWTSMKLFKDTGDLVSPDTILGYTKRSTNSKLIHENVLRAKNHDLIKSYEDTYFKELQKHITIYSGAANPTGIFKRCEKFALKHGTKAQNELGEDVYTYSHPNHYVFVINDHVGKLKSEMHLVEKQLLDKHSEYMGIIRDLFLHIPIDIYQFNRNLGDATRKRNDDVYPRLDDFKGTGDGTENADHILALFEPLRFNLTEFNGYDINSFVSPNNENRFRSISVLKNSYGNSDIDFGYGFLGEVGKFYELPIAKELSKPSQRSKVNKLLFLNGK